MKNFLKRPWVRRTLRGCLWTVITLVTLFLLARQVEDMYGKRRWAAVKARLAQDGESLDMHTIFPAPIPDDQNFCAIPALKDIPLGSWNPDDKSVVGLKIKRLTDSWPRYPGSTIAIPPSLLAGPVRGVATDMKAWAAWFRAASPHPAPATGNPAGDVLAALSFNDPLVAELAQGLSRPESQFTPAWKTRTLPDNPAEIPLPHLTAVRVVGMMLCLRAAAAARAGDPVTAHQSLLIAARLNQASMHEPFLIGILVGCGVSGVIHGATWELCDAHSGTAEDFRALQAALSSMDYRAAYLSTLRGELTYGAGVLQTLKRIHVAILGGRPSDPFELQPPLFVRWLFRLVPGGWYDDNAAAITEMTYDHALKPLRDGGFPELLSAGKGVQALVDDQNLHPFRHLDLMLAFQATGAVSSVSYKVIYTQSVENEAIAACALERYRIEHGAYPGTLEAANHPGEPPIPLDILSGKPMGYRKTPDGRYILWCVGPSGVDHGGKRLLDPHHPEHTKFSAPAYQGDWVWSF